MPESTHSIVRRMEDELAALRSRALFRNLEVSTGIPFNSNDYLGLASHPRLRSAVTIAVQTDALVASTGSRLLSGNAERWEVLEQRFAQFIGTEAALYFSSGYMANLGLLTSVLGPEDTAFSDSANHASLIDGIRLARCGKVVFPHLDLTFLEDALRTHRGGGRKVVVAESVFSMDGDRAPLRELMALCERYDAGLIVDEAHTIGVDGPEGRGSVAFAGRSGCVIASIHTCGKALASMGAFVAGSQTLRDILINKARTFIFTTALPPYCAAHIGEALTLAVKSGDRRDHLRRLGLHLRERMKSSGFGTAGSDSQIVPLILGSNENALRFAAAVAASGFAVRAIRPPTVPPDSARLRLSLTADLSLQDIDHLTDALIAARKLRARVNKQR